MDPATEQMFKTVLAELHDVKLMLHRQCVPVEVLTTEAVATRLGRTLRTVERLFAAGVFSDARPPGKRVNGSSRLTFADEVAAYQSGGVAAVRRLRKQLGR